MAIGRPPIYKSPAEMQRAIDQYFDTLNDKPPTVGGLALSLGFADRKSLNDYAGKDEFEFIVKRAKLAIQTYAETRLYDRDATQGAQFTLKCGFGWTDAAKDRENDLREREIELKEQIAKNSTEIDYEQLAAWKIRLERVFTETAPTRELADYL